MPRFAPYRHAFRFSRRSATLAAAVLALAFTVLGGGDVAPAAARSDYILLSRSALLSLPTNGRAWDYMVGVAHSAWGPPELDDQDNKVNSEALAAALVYARTGDQAMRAKARNALVAMIPTYNLSQDAGLGPARQIAGWVLVADFIGLGGSDDDAFRALLRRALTHPIGTHSRWGASLAACQEDSDNNWGAWCSASRIAAALYLHDSATLARAERVFRGFLGDRNAWSHFRGQGSENAALSAASRSWACNAAATAYVPTNPTCGGRSGAFPSDASRLGPYSRLDAMYQSETTAAVVLSTELLYQNGYPHEWAFRGALARIASFDASHGAWNLGSVQRHWPWLINRRLGTSYPTAGARYGRSLGYTDWLYSGRSGGGGRGGGGTGGGPAATPRPPKAVPAEARPKPTHAPTGARAAASGKSVSADETHGPSDPVSQSSTSTGSEGGGTTGGSADGFAAGGARTIVTFATVGGPAGSPLRRLVAGGLLFALAMWSGSASLRLRARGRDPRGDTETLTR